MSARWPAWAATWRWRWPAAYGTLTLNADGSYSYVVDNTNATVDALNGSDTLTDSFSYTR